MAEVKENAKPSKEAAPVKPKAETGGLYRCVTKCWTNGRLYEVGETVLFAGPAPEHFVKVQ